MLRTIVRRGLERVTVVAHQILGGYLAAMTSSPGWVMLIYRLPREPSTPRISLWRKLKRLGVIQLGDGVVALPESDENREQLDWLADEVIEAAGTATVWTAQPTTRAQQRDMVARANEAADTAYDAIIDEAQAAIDGSERVRVLRRLRRQLHQAQAGDHFGAPHRQAAIDAVAALTDEVAMR
jgi:DNA-binding transcriptional regulator PaaX